MIKIIVFDFDGVIVDSNILKRQAFFDIFSDFNPRAVKAVEDTLSCMGGGTRYEIVKQILVNLGKSAKETTVSDYVEKYNQKTQRGIVSAGLREGVLETLESLSKNYHLYINSGTPETALRESVENLGIAELFKGIYGRPMFGEFIACKEMNLKKILNDELVLDNEVVMIGDEEGDCRAARNCNCFFVGVANKDNCWKKTNFSLALDFKEIINTIKKIY